MPDAEREKPKDPEQGPIEEAQLAIIDLDRFEAAARDPEVLAFLRQAIAADEQLEREGLIHP